MQPPRDSRGRKRSRTSDPTQPAVRRTREPAGHGQRKGPARPGRPGGRGEPGRPGEPGKFGEPAVSFRIVVPLLFLLALALRVVFYRENAANPLLHYQILDQRYYLDLARTIAGGGWLGDQGPFFMDPLYGYILAPFVRLFGNDLTAVRLFQILADSLNAVLIFLIGARLGRPRSGLIAGSFYAVYKVSFFYTLLILKTTLATTGVLLFVLALVRTRTGDRSLRWGWLGAAAALLTFLRGNFILLFPLAAIAYGFIERPGRKRAIRHGLVYAGSFLLVLSLMGIRNYVVTKELLLLNSQFGRMFYCCNNPENVSGIFEVPSFARDFPVELEHDFRAEAERRLGRNLSRAEVSSYWTRETLAFFRDHPGSLLRSLGNKLKRTAVDYETPMNLSFASSRYFSRLARAPLPTFALALALGLPGLALLLRGTRRAAWLLVPLLTVLGTVLLFCTSSRFRFPAVPYLLLGAGATAMGLFERLRARAWPRFLGLLAIAALLFVASDLLYKPKLTGFAEASIAQAYEETGQLAQAEAMARRGLVEHPANTDLLLLLGNLELKDGRTDEAIESYRKILEVDPGSSAALNNLVAAFSNQGNLEEALHYAREGFERTGAETFRSLIARIAPVLQAKRAAEERARSEAGKDQPEGGDTGSGQK